LMRTITVPRAADWPIGDDFALFRPGDAGLSR
jgi:hypothetical protein